MGLGPGQQVQRAVQAGQVLVGRDHVDAIGLNDQAIRDLGDRHAGGAADEFGEDALVVRGQVLDEHEGHAGIRERRQSGKKSLERGQPAGRGAEADDGKRGGGGGNRGGDHGPLLGPCCARLARIVAGCRWPAPGGGAAGVSAAVAREGQQAWAVSSFKKRVAGQIGCGCLGGASNRPFERRSNQKNARALTVTPGQTVGVRARAAVGGGGGTRDVGRARRRRAVGRHDARRACPRRGGCWTRCAPR